MCPQGTHRVEVDGIVLSRQGLELPGAQGLGPPHQGHILRAAKGLGRQGRVTWRSRRRRNGVWTPSGTTPLTAPSPTHPTVKLRLAG